MDRGERIGGILLTGFAVLAVIYFLLPLVIIVGTSFTTTAFLRFPPEGFTLAWYGKFLNDSSYLQSMGLSAVLAASATVTATLLGVPVALVLSRGEVPGGRAIAALFLSPLILPPIVVGAALLQFATTVGIARTFWALFFGHVVLIIPYVVRTTLASLARFNGSLEEAAQDLGATAPETFLLGDAPADQGGHHCRRTVRLHHLVDQRRDQHLQYDGEPDADSGEALQLHPVQRRPDDRGRVGHHHLCCRSRGRGP